MGGCFPMNYKYFSEIYTDETQFLREKMQYFFDKSFKNKDEALLRNLYISLRKLQFDEDFLTEPEPLELTSLAESITVACDILASPSGISFIFCGDEPCYIDGNQKIISKALLNLLSNAYLYGNGNLVTVKTVETNEVTRLEVLSGGNFTNSNKTGKGLSFVHHVCKKMQGNFLIEQSISHTKAIMIFQNSNSRLKFIPTQQTDVLSLVSDRLSPACVEMFGMEYH
jgi:hypothetical protein